MAPTAYDFAKEAAERARRIETRLTRFMIASGVDTGGLMPVWCDDGYIEVPSRAASLTDIASVIPENWDRDYEIAVMFQDRMIGIVLRP